MALAFYLNVILENEYEVFNMQASLRELNVKKKKILPQSFELSHLIWCAKP